MANVFDPSIRPNPLTRREAEESFRDVRRHQKWAEELRDEGDLLGASWHAGSARGRVQGIWGYASDPRYRDAASRLNRRLMDVEASVFEKDRKQNPTRRRNAAIAGGFPVAAEIFADGVIGGLAYGVATEGMRYALRRGQQRRQNPDEEQRRLERAAAEGDAFAQQRLAQMRERTGETRMGLDQDERIVLAATLALKPSYGYWGKAHRYGEAFRYTGITLDRWFAAKARLQRMTINVDGGRAVPVLNKAGAASPGIREYFGSEGEGFLSSVGRRLGIDPLRSISEMKTREAYEAYEAGRLTNPRAVMSRRWNPLTGVEAHSVLQHGLRNLVDARRTTSPSRAAYRAGKAKARAGVVIDHGPIVMRFQAERLREDAGRIVDAADSVSRARNPRKPKRPVVTIESRGGYLHHPYIQVMRDTAENRADLARWHDQSKGEDVRFVQKNPLDEGEKFELARLKARRKEIIAAYGNEAQHHPMGSQIGGLNPAAVELHRIRKEIARLEVKGRPPRPEMTLLYGMTKPTGMGLIYDVVFGARRGKIGRDNFGKWYVVEDGNILVQGLKTATQARDAFAKARKTNPGHALLAMVGNPGLADAAESWARARGLRVPARGTAAWQGMYTAWQRGGMRRNPQDDEIRRMRRSAGSGDELDLRRYAKSLERSGSMPLVPVLPTLDIPAEWTSQFGLSRGRVEGIDYHTQRWPGQTIYMTLFDGEQDVYVRVERHRGTYEDPDADTSDTSSDLYIYQNQVYAGNVVTLPPIKEGGRVVAPAQRAVIRLVASNPRRRSNPQKSCRDCGRAGAMDIRVPVPGSRRAVTYRLCGYCANKAGLATRPTKRNPGPSDPILDIARKHEGVIRVFDDRTTITFTSMYGSTYFRHETGLPEGKLVGGKKIVYTVPIGKAGRLCDYCFMHNLKTGAPAVGEGAGMKLCAQHLGEFNAGRKTNPQKTCQDCGRAGARDHLVPVPGSRRAVTYRLCGYCASKAGLGRAVMSRSRNPGTALLAMVGNPGRSRNPRKRNYSIQRDDGETETFDLRLPRERVKGYLPVEQVRGRFGAVVADKVRWAQEALRDFHGKKVTLSNDVVLYDDGKKDVTVVWTAGRSPEVTYGGEPEDVLPGSVKADALYVHKTNENDRTGKPNVGVDKPTYLMGVVPEKRSGRPVTKDFMLLGHMVSRAGWLRH